jgi:chemotaxis family two-component system sensor kinase Cph1
LVDGLAGRAVSTLAARSCDAEPIHVPGAIQPHGVLVAVDPRTLAIIQVSANCADHFGRSPASVLGRPLTALLGSAAGALFVASSAAAPLTGELVTIDVDGQRFDLLAHRHHDVLIVELERHDPTAPSSDPGLRAALGRLQRPNSVGELCAIAVDAVRKLSGFDRVMMYRFDADGHGEVVDESLGEGVISYLGLHFPAADIPRQARELYLLNWLRLIPDAAYSPVTLIPDPGAARPAPLDLSFATLRSVSPVHLEYLRNMGVRGSMSISLVETDKLWGLIACHHRVPRHVSFATRSACEVIGRVVALQIGAQEALAVRASRESLRGAESRLVEAMRDHAGDVASALGRRGDALLQLTGATGAAVCTAGEIRTVGATPTHGQIAGLVAWLGKQGGAGILQTHFLTALHPGAGEYAHVGSGLLAMTLPHGAPSYVLWFRPEIVHTVTWAGDPAKAVENREGGSSLHPRHSFEAWTEVVRGSSRPWLPAEIDAAEDLRRRAIEADLTHQIARAEEAIRFRDEMVAVVSHDLKNPLQVIEMAVKVLRPHSLENPRTMTTIGRVLRAVEKMNALIHDLLDVAKIESGRFEVTPVPCPISRLVEDASAMLTPIAEAKGVRLVWLHADDLRVDADPERIFQVLSNLGGNAIKFTPAGGVVSIEVQPLDGVVRFAVRDTGPGILAIELAHIFDRYWQARRARSAGSGLGLYISKGIVEAHGQRIWAESTHGAGAAFYFTLPAHVPE